MCPRPEPMAAAEAEGGGAIGMRTGTLTTLMVEDDMVNMDVTGAEVMTEDTMENETMAEAGLMPWQTGSWQRRQAGHQANHYGVGLYTSD
jgi:hypothetical protein